MAEKNQQQESRSSANKRIAKNTIALYTRMLFAMFISLYTSRVVLKTLGVEDFGTYGVVGGIVTLFAFVNSTLVSSTQRFLNFELGSKNDNGVTKVFSNAFHVQVIFCIIVVTLAETVGLYYLNNFIKLPSGRLFAANCVYQFSIFTTVLRILRSPFTASVIAYERMTVFAIAGIVNVILKLLIVYLLLISPYDRLITYAGLSSCISLGMTIFYIYYNQSHFHLCRIKRGVDKSLLKQMLSFSGWSIFGSVSKLATFQGVDLIINYFHGVAVNAALTIANQVYGAAYSLTGNFQTAFNPQITKTYAAGEKGALFDLVYRTTRYSFFLVIICAIPLIFQCENLLELWLDKVPLYARDFCYFIIAVSVVDALAAPLWMSAYARGNIKKYQITISCILFINFPLSALFMAIGLSPTWAVIIRFLVACVAFCYRLLYMKKALLMPLKYYFLNTVKPCLFVFVPAAILAFSIDYFLNLHTILMTLMIVFTTILCVLLIGLNKNERKQIRVTVFRKFHFV